MSRHLDADLAKWEAGDLSPDDLARAHPDVDVPALMALHHRMGALGEMWVPDAAAVWAALAPGLAEVAAPRRRRVRRSLVAGILAGSLAVPTLAYAAAPDAVRGTVRKAVDLLPGVRSTPSRAPADAPAPSGEPAPTPPRTAEGSEEPDDHTTVTSGDADHDDDDTVTTATTAPEGSDAPEEGSSGDGSSGDGSSSDGSSHDSDADASAEGSGSSTSTTTPDSDD